MANGRSGATFLIRRMPTFRHSNPRLPLAVDANAPQYKREYRQKVVYFRGQLPIYSMRPIADAKGEVRLRRSWVFENNPMTYASGLWSRLKVRILPIMVVNAANGLSHHPKKMFNPSYGLFRLGLAISHHRFLDAYFVPGFYKMVLGKKNIKDIDYELYSLKVSFGCCALSIMPPRLSWIELNCPFFRDYDITFVLEESSVTEDRLGEFVGVELNAGGANLPMTEVNKE